MKTSPTIRRYVLADRDPESRPEAGIRRLRLVRLPSEDGCRRPRRAPASA